MYIKIILIFKGACSWASSQTFFSNMEIFATWNWVMFRRLVKWDVQNLCTFRQSQWKNLFEITNMVTTFYETISNIVFGWKKVTISSSSKSFVKGFRTRSFKTMLMDRIQERQKTNDTLRESIWGRPTIDLHFVRPTTGKPQKRVKMGKKIDWKCMDNQKVWHPVSTGPKLMKKVYVELPEILKLTINELLKIRTFYPSLANNKKYTGHKAYLYAACL